MLLEQFLIMSEGFGYHLLCVSLSFISCRIIRNVMFWFSHFCLFFFVLLCISIGEV